MTHDEEACGLPTASGHWGADACPGSYLMEKGIPEEPPSEAALHGIHVHEAFVSVTAREALTDEERETYHATSERIGAILDQTGFPHVDFAERETRLWHSNEPENPFKISGKPDVVYAFSRRMLIIDVKTGRNTVPANHVNKQLRRLAVLARRNYGVSEIWTAIAQPWAKNQPPCKYDADDLDCAEAEMWAELEVATNAGAPLVAGDWCRYCRARAVCPQSTGRVLDVANIVALVEDDKRVQLCPADRLAAMANACTIAEVIIDAIKGEIRRRLTQDPAAVPGWALEPGAERSEIIDAQKAFEAVARKVSETEFRACCTVWPGKLKKAWCASVGAKGKAKDAAIEEMEKLLGPWLQKSQNKPSLVRKDT